MASSGRWKSEMALASRPRPAVAGRADRGNEPEETRTMMDLIVKLASERTVILVEHKMKLVLGISDRILVLAPWRAVAEERPWRFARTRRSSGLSWPAGALIRCCRSAI